MQSKSSQHYGTSPLSRVLEQVTKPAFKKRGFAECRIITDWEKIVGEIIARYSSPQKLVFPPDTQEKGVLHVEVYDSAFATEIHYLGPLIREKIATYFGYPAVSRLNIIQKPLVVDTEKPPYIAVSKENTLALEASLEGMEDLAIKEALRSLGRYVVSDSITPSSQTAAPKTSL